MSSKPLLSIMIPTYNPIYLQETLLSVINQVPDDGSFQIVVVDDCTSNQNLAVQVASLNRSNVKYFRQNTNVGHIENFNTCLRLAEGELIQILHDDDIVIMGFYAKVIQAFLAFPDAGAFFSQYYYIDSSSQITGCSETEQAEFGIVPNFLERIAISQRLQYCCLVAKAEAYSKVGFFSMIDHAEDWDMFVRLACLFPFVYIPEILAAYRVHDSGRSSVIRRTGQNIRDERIAIQSFNSFLPNDLRTPLYRKALIRLSKWGLTLSRGYAGKGDLIASINLLREAVASYCSLETICEACEIIFRNLYHQIRLILSPKLYLRDKANGEYDIS